MIEHIYRAGAQVRMFGSSVVDGIYVATNRVSLYYEVGVKPWDVAGISLIITEAGGEVSGWGDRPFSVLAPRVFVCGAKTAVREFKELVAKAGIRP